MRSQVKGARKARTLRRRALHTRIRSYRGKSSVAAARARRIARSWFPAGFSVGFFLQNNPLPKRLRPSVSHALSHIALRTLLCALYAVMNETTTSRGGLRTGAVDELLRLSPHEQRAQSESAKRGHHISDIFQARVFRLGCSAQVRYRQRLSSPIFSGGPQHGHLRAGRSYFDHRVPSCGRTRAAMLAVRTPKATDPLTSTCADYLVCAHTTPLNPHSMQLLQVHSRPSKRSGQVGACR